MSSNPEKKPVKAVNRIMMWNDPDVSRLQAENRILKDAMSELVRFTASRIHHGGHQSDYKRTVRRVREYARTVRIYIDAVL